MLAYVRLVQSREKELGVDVLTHQKWSGAAYMDGILGAIQSGSSGSKSMGEGNTEKGTSSARKQALNVSHLLINPVQISEHACAVCSKQISLEVMLIFNDCLDSNTILCILYYKLYPAKSIGHM